MMFLCYKLFMLQTLYYVAVQWARIIFKRIDYSVMYKDNNEIAEIYFSSSVCRDIVSKSAYRLF